MTKLEKIKNETLRKYIEENFYDFNFKIEAYDEILKTTYLIVEELPPIGNSNELLPLILLYEKDGIVFNSNHEDLSFGIF